MPGKRSLEPTRTCKPIFIELIGLTSISSPLGALGPERFLYLPESGAGREGLLAGETDRYGAILGDLPPDLRQERRGEGGLRAAIRPRTRHRASIGGGGGSLPNPPFGLGGGAGSPGEGEGRAAKLAGGRESGRGPDRLEGKQREENARFLERALVSLETARKEYEQGEVRLARTDEESKRLRLELQQARILDVQLESALKARSEADERMKDFSRRKQEAEEKLRKVEERQKKARRNGTS